MYLEILKGRETGIGHSSVFDLNGIQESFLCKKKTEQLKF